MGLAIVWGEKQKNAFIGIAADYCIICRQVRPFAAYQLSVVSHVYWIPTSSARPVARVGVCMACGTSTAFDADQFAYVPQFDGDLRKLVSVTNPCAFEVAANRAQLELAARQRTLKQELRNQLIAEPFQMLAPDVEQLYARDRRGAQDLTVAKVLMIFSPIHVINSNKPTGSLSPAASWCVITTIFAPIIFFAVGGGIAGSGPIPLWSLIGAVLSVPIGIFCTAKLQGRHRHHMLRSRLIPLLGHSLAGINPTAEELQNVMAMFAANSYRIGMAFTPADILEAIERSAAGSTSP